GDIILGTVNNGKLGINTADPSKELDVNGDISLEAGSGDFYSNDGTQGLTDTFSCLGYYLVDENGDNIGDENGNVIVSEEFTVTVKNGIVTGVA
ncbi:MAG: hypothetical protein KJN62_08720, partial [Deltaproteobacteria bacterium]|nr:hypothetical protein [Deltaproteobacteria bacterium]